MNVFPSFLWIVLRQNWVLFFDFFIFSFIAGVFIIFLWLGVPSGYPYHPLTWTLPLFSLSFAFLALFLQKAYQIMVIVSLARENALVMAKTEEKNEMGVRE